MYLIPLWGGLLILITNIVKKELTLIWISITLLINVLWIEKVTVSSILVIITLIIIPGSLISTWTNWKLNNKIYLILILTLESILIKFFTTENKLILYITFEISLIPLYLIVKGKQNNNTNVKRATNLLFIYTLVGSLIMLVGLLIGISEMNNINDFEWIEMTNKSLIIWLLLFVGLSFKIPLIPFHIWLFRAHAEAPISVSILLSSVILKIATFGYLVLLLIQFPNESLYIIPILEIVLIITLIYSSLSAIRQNDIKSLVAMSSVSHQSIVIIGIFSIIGIIHTDNNKLGLAGILILSLGHGFVSPGLFLFTGSILYDRYHSRNIYYYRGLNNSMPQFTTLILIFTLINLGLPLTLNFFGEMISIMNIIKSNLLLGILTSITIVLSALYSILLWSRLNYGIINNYLYFSFDLNRRESFTLFSWLLFIVILGVIPNLIISLLILDY